MKNWKTTGTGIIGLITVIWNCITKKAVGPEDFAAATASIGLLLAKDSNVTGGTVVQS